MADNEYDFLDKIFHKARTHKAWLDKTVSNAQLQDIYNSFKWGPTSANCCPLRILFVRTQPEKEKLLLCLDKGNVEKVRTAPVTAILAQDMKFYEQSKLVTHGSLREMFVGKSELIESTAFRNSSLQGAYFMIAARAAGLDCGPMSGFDNDKVDEVFFNGTSWKSNFLCNIGYGDASKLYPRAPRLDFQEACRII